MAWYKVGGGGIKSDEVTATKAEVLAGKTALTSDSNDEVGTGTLPLASVLADNGGSMTNNGAVSGSVGVSGTYTIPQGYHNGSGTVAGPTLTGSASTAVVLSGYTFYNNTGTKQTGAMTNNGALGGTIGVNGSYSIPAGYTTGGTVSQNITTHSDSGYSAIGINGSKSFAAGYYYNAHGVNQSVTTYNDSGNVAIGYGGSKSYPAGYYYNAHGAYNSISAYTGSIS